MSFWQPWIVIQPSTSLEEASSLARLNPRERCSTAITFERSLDTNKDDDFHRG
jgi:hypothetical protein